MIGWYGAHSTLASNNARSLTLLRASFVFSLQTWLAEGPEASSKGTPGILSVGMACMYPDSSLMGIFTNRTCCLTVLALGVVRLLRTPTRWESHEAERMHRHICHFSCHRYPLQEDQLGQMPPLQSHRHSLCVQGLSGVVELQIPWSSSENI